MADDKGLVELGRELERVRRRAAQLHRFMKRSSTDWAAAWSQAVEHSLNVVLRIDHLRPAGLEGPQVKYQAILHRIWIDHGAVADEELRRSLRRFGRALEQVATRQAGRGLQRAITRRTGPTA